MSLFGGKKAQNSLLTSTFMFCWSHLCVVQDQNDPHKQGVVIIH